MAWWVEKEMGGGVQVIRRHSFAGMPTLYSFLNSALAAMPGPLSGFDTSGCPIEGEVVPISEELQQPRRLKLKDPGLQDPEARREIMKEIIAAMADDNEAGNPDVALAAWFPEGGDEPIRFPDEPVSQPCPV